jgi:hypothetical protein
MIKADLIFFLSDGYRISLNKIRGYYTFSSIIRKSIKLMHQIIRRKSLIRGNTVNQVNEIHYGKL